MLFELASHKSLFLSQAGGAPSWLHRKEVLKHTVPISSWNKGEKADEKKEKKYFVSLYFM